MDQNKRDRNFCFTVFHYTDATIHAYREMVHDHPHVKYLIFGKEICPLTDQPHLQCFVQFFAKNNKSYSQVKQIFHQPPATFRCVASDGTAAQGAHYCKKDKNFEEFGVPPVSSKRKGQNEQERWAATWESAQSGCLEEIDAEIRIKHYRTLKQIKNDYQKKPGTLGSMDFHLYWGPSGTGKSHNARLDSLLENSYYVKELNKWWCGYQQETTVIIEELTPDSVKYLNSYLKKWLDIYPFTGEFKGGSNLIRPERIIITSNFTFDELFSDTPNMYEPMKRRLSVKHFGTPYTNVVHSAFLE